MSKIIISDTSCLILFEKIEALELLHSLFGKVHITPIIAREFGSTLPEWFVIEKPVNTEFQVELQKIVDEGEASALALAAENKNSLLIMDDKKGRSLAQKMGILITGTLGVLVDAKLRGIIPSVQPFIVKVKETNFRISSELEAWVLAKAGE